LICDKYYVMDNSIKLFLKHYNIAGGFTPQNMLSTGQTPNMLSTGHTPNMLSTGHTPNMLSTGQTPQNMLGSTPHSMLASGTTPSLSNRAAEGSHHGGPPVYAPVASPAPPTPAIQPSATDIIPQLQNIVRYDT
jgi:hypothetical protein